ncbi:hypothetical protein LOTGIDRAFT_239611 [Lottia gigantea]|uniref:Fibronectin type-III domain-containing protein n=1 Tax=Lottia gigantea TaxID=225164 RepID=V3ZCE2_LOTGI|nr:hypothetical protein LOTGIDRAFT_239611 [Lottia gigantea]ESO88733.1 hypothetical protein LOTGIDRAFT_239611 [Lottia gigantea]
MDLKWLKTMIILSVGLCLVFTVIGKYLSVFVYFVCTVYYGKAKIVITLNGSLTTRRRLHVNDTMMINCTVPSKITFVHDFSVRKRYSTIKRFVNSYTGTMTKKIRCDDNTYFRCYGVPRWNEDIHQPVIFFSSQAADKNYYLEIPGEPRPTYSVQKFTSTGLQDLPLNVDVNSFNTHAILHFRNYTEDSHGVYQIVANNSLGTFTTNFTLRGLLVSPKNLRARSTTTTSIQVEWTTGELFETGKHEYKHVLYKKKEYGSWDSDRYFNDIRLTVNYTVNFLQPNTTYYFLVQAMYRYSTKSFYSNLAQATTLNKTHNSIRKSENWYENVDESRSLAYSGLRYVNNTYDESF